MRPWYGHTAVIWAVSLLILVADFFIGPFVSFPIVLFFPISMMAWWHTARSAYILAIVLVIVRFLGALYLKPAGFPLSPHTSIDTLVYLSVFLLLGCLINEVAKERQLLQREIKTLEGLLPICSYCKKIRTDGGEWQQLESYIIQHSEATFTHSICPTCKDEHFGYLKTKTKPTP